MVCPTHLVVRSFPGFSLQKCRNSRAELARPNNVKVPFMNRRAFLLGSALAAPYALSAQGKVPRVAGVRLKLGLNAYSFDKPLRAGEMTLEDLVVFAAQNNFDALD